MPRPYHDAGFGRGLGQPRRRRPPPRATEQSHEAHHAGRDRRRRLPPRLRRRRGRPVGGAGLQQLQRAPHLGRRLEPIARVLGQQPAAQLVDPGVGVRHQVRRQRRLHVQHLAPRFLRGHAVERLDTGEAFVEQDAQREQVAARIGALALQHFRRDVAGRSGDALCRLEVGGRRAVRLLGGVAHLGDAEVEQLRRARRRHHDVLRLQVAVDDAVAVRGVQSRRRCRASDLERLAHPERPAPQPRRERFAVDVLHDDEVAAAGVGADFVDGADVRMVEGGGRLRLAQQPAADLVVARRRVAQELDGDLSRFSRVSWARNTSPMPPLPRRRCSW